MSVLVRQESTGWRDEGLSRRHREWGYDCPALDIDFLLVEYDKLVPIALIDYKCNSTMSEKSPSFSVLEKLGDMAGLPSFWVNYSVDFSFFKVHPINGIAKRLQYISNGESVCVFQKRDSIILSEQRFVKFLYFLRGR